MVVPAEVDEHEVLPGRLSFVQPGEQLRARHGVGRGAGGGEGGVPGRGGGVCHGGDGWWEGRRRISLGGRGGGVEAEEMILWFREIGVSDQMCRWI